MKILIVFVLLLSLMFLNPSPTYAFEFDFFGLRGAVEELVHGPKQQEEQKPSIFQQFFSWIGSIWKKGDVLPPKSSPTPTPVNNPFPKPSQNPALELKETSTLPDPDNAGQPLPSAKSTSAPQNNLSGHWGGDYVVNSPDECKGGKGSWSADLIQTGNRLGGSFSSDAGGGQVGGNVGGSGVSWSVGGGGGQIQFTGKITGPNSVLGTFTGVVCDEEKAPQQTRGTFFGGRL